MMSGYVPQQQNGAGLLQFLQGTFGNSGSPYEAAMGPYKQFNNQAASYQNPFVQAGQNALAPYQNMLGNMSNPSQFINTLMSQYQQSPWAKFSTQQGLNANTNAASASGLIGSTPYQQAGQQYAQNISSQDMQNWLGNTLGINNQALQGYGNLIQGGQGAANQLTNLYGNEAAGMGNLAYGQQQGQNQDFLNQIGGGLNMFLNGIF